LVLLLSRLGGLLVAITGILAFLDAWSAGIRKDASKKSFLNISPMAWGIVIMWLFVISYPIYVFTRNRLKTKNGTTGYWVATNVLGVIMLAMFAIQVAAYLGQQP
jgi:hypothetical protein